MGRNKKCKDTKRLQRKRPCEPSTSTVTKRRCLDGSAESPASNYDPLEGVVMPFPPLGEFEQWIRNFQSWTDLEKNQAIDELINCSAVSQIRHMMKSIEPFYQRDFISLLPREVAFIVLGYLQPKDLLRAAQTCQTWKFLADDNLLWKKQCHRVGITTLKKMPRSVPRCASPWKAVYMREYVIENNWLHKPVNNPIFIRGHKDRSITCLQFYGNKILTGSEDTTLKVWSAISGRCLRTLSGHSGGVWSAQMVGDTIISGSTDRTLRVWNAKNGKCLKVLSGHISTVRCMQLHEDRVVSGSFDANIRVWSISDGICQHILVGHEAAVHCVQFDGKLVVSGAYDFLVKVWNPDTGMCLHTFAAYTKSFLFDGHNLLRCFNSYIVVNDAKTSLYKYTLKEDTSFTYVMKLHDNLLFTVNTEYEASVWDMTNGKCLRTLGGPNGHRAALTDLQVSNHFVITSSKDGTVKLWDVRTGEFIRNLVELGSGGCGGYVRSLLASETKLICFVRSRHNNSINKLLVFDFNVPGERRKCDQ